MPKTKTPQKTALDAQAERLGEAVGDLIRAYQFRDRNEICCHGVSVSQCYALEALHRKGPLTMGRLSDYLYLDVSTVTRVVDQLKAEGYVERVQDPDDRRVVRAEITRGGRAVVRKIRGSLAADYRNVIESIPADSRDAVVGAVEQLHTAFLTRSSCCADRRPAKE
jgi:MarR family 2-MHQ and catechol resistance regulon transcriptional repressor